jgi:hypothetical protein
MIMLIATLIAARHRLRCGSDGSMGASYQRMIRNAQSQSHRSLPVCIHGLVRSVASNRPFMYNRALRRRRRMFSGGSPFTPSGSHSYLLHTNKNNKRPESWTLDQNKQLADKDCMRGDAFVCHMTIGFGCSVFTEVQDFRGPLPTNCTRGHGRGQEHNITLIS